MNRPFHRRTAAAVAVGAVSLPALLLAASPAHAASASIEPPTSEMPWCDEVERAEDISVFLEGVPEEVTAPEEWQEYTYQVHNGTDEPIGPIYTRTTAWYNSNDGVDEPYPFNLQWWVDDEWREVPWESDSYDGHFGEIAELAPGETGEAQIRTRGHLNRPGWVDVTVSARFHGAEGSEDHYTCYTAERAEQWALIVADEEPEPTDPEPSEPGEPSPEPNAPQPQTGSDGDADDDRELAATGGSSALPVAAAVGGVVLVAGVGAVVLARRSRTTA
ncbi:LAETG motif-containing sortase-dependent surface protein [Streptomyces profundus]|uniref:LAETG motif-containing sortase-dependent surface protein n=1 Tax=Streptomyces profundus TaxID=2867410 RepID=UPI001D16DE15|nr:LAETG motif-containing sortase-dependent surface protein [Streptomyces sp. MA3_2.13]UED84097.1 hypothetical protein K4G22_07655 [Streptomyces sp. MA3_2.13]